MKHSPLLLFQIAAAALLVTTTTVTTAVDAADATNTNTNTNADTAPPPTADLDKMENTLLNNFDLNDMQLDETEICDKLAKAQKCIDDDVREVCPKTCSAWEEEAAAKMTAENVDETEICEKLAKNGDCMNHEEVWVACPKSCQAWKNTMISSMDSRAVDIDIDGDEVIFFDLTAKTYNDNKDISFDRFEGYLTIVTNLSKTCHTQDVEMALSYLTTLFNIMPYSLNVIVFPFLHPKIDYEEHEEKYDCDDMYRSKLRSYATNPKLKNKFFIMEELETLNGGSSISSSNSNYNDDDSGKDNEDEDAVEDLDDKVIHPVYTYLKSKIGMKDLFLDYATFFFISPMGDRIDLLQGSSFEGVRDYVRQLTKKNYEL